MQKYWLVGASYGGDGGADHQDQKFVEQGLWMLGWKEEDQPTEHKKAMGMSIGDRVAIKRMKARGQTGITILHLGIVKGVILDANKIICTIDWVATDLDRNIDDSRGCFTSINGPFEHDEWIEKIFCL